MLRATGAKKVPSRNRGVKGKVAGEKTAVVVGGGLAGVAAAAVMAERGVEAQEDRFILAQDCPSFEPGSSLRRPGVETPIQGLALAGDFLRLPFPSALMERAVASGFMAANHLMGPWDVRPEPIYSIPDKGFLSFLP